MSAIVFGIILRTVYCIISMITVGIDFFLFIFYIIALLELYTLTKFQVTWMTFWGSFHVIYGQKMTKIQKISFHDRPPAAAGLVLLL